MKMNIQLALKTGLAALLLSASTYAVAAEPADEVDVATTDAAPSWSSRCNGDGRRAEALNCAVVQRLFVKKSGQLIASITIRMSTESKAPMMMIQTPLGLFLPAGVSIDVDGKGAQKLELQTCDGKGCYAGSAVSVDLLASMQKGQTLNMRFQNMNKQPITLPVSLSGFSSAYNKIK